ncbi:IS3 family transposase, partial [Pedobacter jejuensis]
ERLVLMEISVLRSSHPEMGGRKLYEMLRPFFMEHGIKMGRDSVFELLAANGLQVKRRSRKYITTYSGHWLRKWPNIIREVEVVRVNQLWVSDITYWKVCGQYLYISFVTDAYSRKIVGYHVAGTLETVETLKALEMALKKLKAGTHQLIHHSDRGVQYCSGNYVAHLQKNGIGISMTENGDPLENAMAERINGIIKGEYLRHLKTDNIRQAKGNLRKAVELYNGQRPHLSLGMKTPNQVHEKNLNTKRLWKNYYNKKCKVVDMFNETN